MLQLQFYTFLLNTLLANLFNLVPRLFNTELDNKIGLVTWPLKHRPKGLFASTKDSEDEAGPFYKMGLITTEQTKSWKILT